MKSITILGASGSIGTSALKVLDNHADKFCLHAVSVNRRLDKLFEIIKKYRPDYAVCADGEYFFNKTGKTSIVYEGIPIYSGCDGMERICHDKVDSVLNAVAGKAGVTLSFAVMGYCKELALANKESVVCAGDLLFNEAAKNDCKIIPVDSEHSAIFSLLKDKSSDLIQNIHITASGGPFLNVDKSTWNKITPADALKHPTWSMGRKISIDSATMANKGLEVIEAHYLFSMPYEKINVVVHPQSLIHSMVEMIDGEIYAQLGPKDMAIPIQNAFSYPDVIENNYSRLNFFNGLTLEFLPIDMQKFRMLDFAIQCGKKGGIYPAFFNNVNEFLVMQFLDEKISFLQIETGMEKSLELLEKENFQNEINSIDDLLEIDLLSCDIAAKAVKIIKGE
ncbi:MAG: 1-deoxy-D-xylulose-5-phosphate reductoisomerase [Spirochaetales bacterium]|nr:1-deoxy-D-xylulose-5-phosphate reductoisomerase [Spirochaetales bacterium]